MVLFIEVVLKKGFQMVMVNTKVRKGGLTNDLLTLVFLMEMVLL